MKLIENGISIHLFHGCDFVSRGPISSVLRLAPLSRRRPASSASLRSSLVRSVCASSPFASTVAGVAYALAARPSARSFQLVCGLLAFLSIVRLCPSGFLFGRPQRARSPRRASSLFSGFFGRRFSGSSRPLFRVTFSRVRRGEPYRGYGVARNRRVASAWISRRERATRVSYTCASGLRVRRCSERRRLPDVARSPRTSRFSLELAAGRVPDELARRGAQADAARIAEQWQRRASMSPTLRFDSLVNSATPTQPDDRPPARSRRATSRLSCRSPRALRARHSDGSTLAQSLLRCRLSRTRPRSANVVAAPRRSRRRLPADCRPRRAWSSSFPSIPPAGRVLDATGLRVSDSSSCGGATWTNGGTCAGVARNIKDAALALGRADTCLRCGRLPCHAKTVTSTPSCSTDSSRAFRTSLIRACLPPVSFIPHTRFATVATLPPRAFRPRAWLVTPRRASEDVTHARSPTDGSIHAVLPVPRSWRPRTKTAIAVVWPRMGLSHEGRPARLGDLAWLCGSRLVPGHVVAAAGSGGVS